MAKGSSRPLGSIDFWYERMIENRYFVRPNATLGNVTQAARSMMQKHSSLSAAEVLEALAREKQPLVVAGV